jgi:5-enolpyruvylshikimate-3-phosphate synthase
MAAAAFATAPVEIRGLGTLAGKESNRIEAMSQWLRAIGATVESGADWIRIDGRLTHAKEISLNKSNTNSVGTFKASLDTKTNLNTVVNENSSRNADTNSQPIHAEIVVNPYADHRIAMSAAVAGALRGGISISDPGCVEKSWPSFWNDWHRLLSRIEGSA